jgi:perosamine synthetase
MNDKFKTITDFIHELYPGSGTPVPLHAPVFSGNEKEYLNDCIDTTFVSSVGNYVELFENRIADYTGSSRAVACMNGTNALFLALKLAGVEAGEEVITQPLTFIATANAIAYCGAFPVFLDVDRATLGLSPERVEEFLSKETRRDNKTNRVINIHTQRAVTACVPVHTFGHPNRIDEIIEICNRYGIPVIEDAAESIGSFYKKQHTGTFGMIGMLSFNGNKTITTGGGGMLLFRDGELGKKAKHLTTQAKVEHPWEFNHDAIGYNYRMPNINAALGVAQLEKLDLLLEKKRNLAGIYREFFKGLGIPFFTEPADAVSNYWLNTIFAENRDQRDEFLAFSRQQGITSRPAWTLMHKLSMFRDSYHDDLVNAMILEDTIINLPSSPIL